MFTRRVAAGKVPAGAVVGTNHGNGYLSATVGGTKYFMHRLAMLYMTGDFPDQAIDVDHIDGNRANNSYSNLRLVKRGRNLQNLSCFGRPSNKIGHLGVHLHKASGLWRAGVIKPGTRKQICSYHKSLEDAVKTAVSLRVRYYPGFTGRDAEQALVNFG